MSKQNHNYQARMGQNQTDGEQIDQESYLQAQNDAMLSEGAAIENQEQHRSADDHTSSRLSARSFAEWDAQVSNQTNGGADHQDDSQGQSNDQKASGAMENTKEQATAMWNDTKNRVTEGITERRTEVATRIGRFATALHQTGNELKGNDENAIAHYAESAANQLDRFSDYVKRQDVKGMWNDVQGMARTQPELFAAGALAAGFLGGRFLRNARLQSNNRA